MNTRNLALVLALATLVSSPLSSQWRPLNFARDTSYNMRLLGFPRPAWVLAGRDGRMLLVPEYFQGEVVAYDSMFKKLPWTLSVGRGPNGDVFYVTQWGWVGDSVWLLDPFYKQVAIVGAKGTLAKSISWPTWVRPFWSDRRKYPLFSSVLAWHAAYPDATLLVEPTQPRHLLDTPQYDPDQRMLVRIDGDGRILKTIARIPAMEGRFQLRSGTEKQWVTVPNFAKAIWKASTDGRRIAVVSPISSDSGAFRITAIDENGDTVFSRRYAVEAARIAKERIDTILAAQKEFGRYTAAQVRDTVRKLFPAFYSPIVSADVGLDNSIWVSVRRPSTKVEDAEYFVVDAKGEPQGVLTVPRPTRFVSLSLGKIWVIQQDRVKNTSLLIRFLPAGAKGARPFRSELSGASSLPARSPE
jgi:hypothetical protein